MPFQTLTQDPTNHATAYQSGRPARVKNIEVMRSIVREKCGDQRISNGFERAIGDCEDERAPIKEPVSNDLCLARRGCECDQRREHMQSESSNDQLAITNFVANDPANNDAEAKASEPGTVDGAKLLAGEPEICTPVSQNTATNTKADASRQNGHEPCNQESFGIRRDCFITGLNVAHIY